MSTCTFQKLQKLIPSKKQSVLITNFRSCKTPKIAIIRKNFMPHGI